MAPNFRELIGFSTPKGRQILPGMLFRSGAFEAQDADALRQLISAYGIRLCCDLRSAIEREKNPIPWPEQAPRPRLLELQVFNDMRALGESSLAQLVGDVDGHAATTLMQNLYRKLPETCAPVLRRLFTEIANHEQTLPFMVNCTAGKDRTGVIVALLLTALDIEEAQIRADYLRSTDLIHRPEYQVKVERLVQDFVGVKPQPASVQALIGVNSLYLNAAMAAIKMKYGSAHQYLRTAVGLDLATQSRLQSRLLKEA